MIHADMGKLDKGMQVMGAIADPSGTWILFIYFSWWNMELTFFFKKKSF